MKNIIFFTILAILGISSTSAQVSTNKSKSGDNVIQDLLKPAVSAKVTGYIGEKLDASYTNRIMAQDVNHLIVQFQSRTETRYWQTEFWGKWFTSAVLAYRYRPEPELKTILDKAVSGLIATQTPDGYIGNYAEGASLGAWDIWGRKYCMLGLLAYYDITKEKKALQACSKLADHLIKELADKNILIVKQGSHRGMAATSVLEPISLLYGRTGEKRYLDFAEEIVRQWESADGPQLIAKADVNVSERFPVPPPETWYGALQGSKAYEMMSCYEGLLELYRLTGKEKYRQAVEKTWQNIMDTEITVVGSGSAMECWFGGKKLQTIPIHHLMETCVTATWIKLSQQLLRLTGEAKYADAIEKAYYNALLGSMKPDGSTWSYFASLAGYRLEREGQCGMDIHCCLASGPRALFTYPITSVMSRNDGLQVNFFAGGAYTLQTPGKQSIRLIQETDYPVSGNIKIRVELTKPEEMELHVRIPQWSKQTTLTVNMQEVNGVNAGQYAVIGREWKNGDEINLGLDMRGVVIRPDDRSLNLAIQRGPIVLARDSRLPGPVLDAWINPVKDKDGYVKLEADSDKHQGIWMQFRADCISESPGRENNKPVSMILCDYSSAGNTFDEESRYRVWFPQELDPTTFKRNEK